VASVLLATPESAQPGFDAERNVQNQVGIMTSAAVLGQAAKRQGGGMTVVGALNYRWRPALLAVDLAAPGHASDTVARARQRRPRPSVVEVVV
jgi:hypothetical protein